VTFYCDKRAVAILEDGERGKALSLQLCQPMGQILKTILPLRQEAERRIEKIIAEVRGD